MVTDPPSERVVIALSLRAAGQGIVHTVVQAANCLVVVSLLVDFEAGAQEKLGRKLFDCEPDGVRRVPKPSVTNGSSPGFLLATGEQLRRGVIIEFDYDLFDCGVFDRHLFERYFFDHDCDVLLGFDVMTRCKCRRREKIPDAFKITESVVQADELRPLLSESQAMLLLNALVTPDLSGSAISVVIF